MGERRLEDIHADSILPGRLGEAIQFVHRCIQPSVGDLRRRHHVPDAPSAKRFESLLRIARNAAASRAALARGRFSAASAGLAAFAAAASSPTAFTAAHGSS